MANVAGRFGGYVKDKFDHKGFSRLDENSGSIGWGEWMFNLSICASRMNQEFDEMMGKVEHLKLENLRTDTLMEELHRDSDGAQEM